MPVSQPNRYFDPQILSQLSGLQVRARCVVDGLLSGLHTSLLRGFSVEFSEHREYAPGDDIRHIDWKTYAKRDRYYVKEYEEETTVRAYLLVDQSASMAYRSGPLSKYDYGSLLAVSLAYLMLKQQDSVGLITLGEELDRVIPAQSYLGHTKVIAEALEGRTPEGRTSLKNTLPAVASLLRRRGFVVLISDLLEEPEDILAGLRQLRHQNHEVVVFHILDPEEIEFPFRHLSQFEDLESDQRVIADPLAIGIEYRKQVKAFIHQLRGGCHARSIDYALFNTQTPLDRALIHYLGRRRQSSS